MHINNNKEQNKQNSKMSFKNYKSYESELRTLFIDQDVVVTNRDVINACFGMDVDSYSVVSRQDGEKLLAYLLREYDNCNVELINCLLKYQIATFTNQNQQEAYNVLLKKYEHLTSLFCQATKVQLKFGLETEFCNYDDRKKYNGKVSDIILPILLKH